MSTELEATTKNPDKFNLDGSDQPSSASTSGVALKYFADLSKAIESDHTAVVGETEIVSGLAVRKPHKQEWFRVHPDNSYSISTRIIEEKETKEVYWITPDLWSKFVGQSKSVLLTVCVTEQKSLFVWAITNPDPRGRSSSWVESAHRAA